MAAASEATLRAAAALLETVASNQQLISNCHCNTSQDMTPIAQILHGIARLFEGGGVPHNHTGLPLRGQHPLPAYLPPSPTTSPRSSRPSSRTDSHSGSSTAHSSRASRTAKNIKIRLFMARNKNKSLLPTRKFKESREQQAAKHTLQKLRRASIKSRKSSKNARDEKDHPMNRRRSRAAKTSIKLKLKGSSAASSRQSTLLKRIVGNYRVSEETRLTEANLKHFKTIMSDAADQVQDDSPYETKLDDASVSSLSLSLASLNISKGLQEPAKESTSPQLLSSPSSPESSSAGAEQIQAQQGVQTMQGVQTEQEVQTMQGVQTEQEVQTMQEVQTEREVQNMQGVQTEQVVQAQQGAQAQQGIQTEQEVQTEQEYKTQQGEQAQQGDQAPHGVQAQPEVQAPQTFQFQQGAQAPQGLPASQMFQAPQGFQAPQQFRAPWKSQDMQGWKAPQRFLTQPAVQPKQHSVQGKKRSAFESLEKTREVTQKQLRQKKEEAEQKAIALRAQDAIRKERDQKTQKLHEQGDVQERLRKEHEAQKQAQAEAEQRLKNVPKEHQAIFQEAQIALRKEQEEKEQEHKALHDQAAAQGRFYQEQDSKQHRKEVHEQGLEVARRYKESVDRRKSMEQVERENKGKSKTSSHRERVEEKEKMLAARITGLSGTTQTRPYSERAIQEPSALWKDVISRVLTEQKFLAGDYNRATVADLKTAVTEGTWLNDGAINSFLERVARVRAVYYGWHSNKKEVGPKYWALTSHMYTTVKREGWVNVSRWIFKARLSGRHFWAANNLLIPINEGAHWTLLTVSPAAKTVSYFDSMGGSPDKYLDFAAEFIKVAAGEKTAADQFKFRGQRSQQQRNCNDCGVFTCINGLCVIMETDEEPYNMFHPDEIPAARLQIAAVILGVKREDEWWTTGDEDPPEKYDSMRT